MMSSSNLPLREIWTGFTKTFGEKKKKKKKDKEDCCDVKFLAVAQFLALCPRVNIAVMVSWDILGLKKTKQKKNKTKQQFVSIQCVVFVLVLMLCTSYHLQDQKKKAKHEDVEQEAWI